MSKLAWHFVDKCLRDGRPIPPDGEWLEYKGVLDPCKQGLHASERIVDALTYAPGDILCRVELGGDMIEVRDKIVAKKRKILWRINARELLKKAACLFALEIIHLWNAPPIVKEFLETGNEDLWGKADEALKDEIEKLNEPKSRSSDAAFHAIWVAKYAIIYLIGRLVLSPRDAVYHAAKDMLIALRCSAANKTVEEEVADCIKAQKKQEEILIKLVEEKRKEFVA